MLQCFPVLFGHHLQFKITIAGIGMGGQSNIGSQILDVHEFHQQEPTLNRYAIGLDGRFLGFALFTISDKIWTAFCSSIEVSPALLPLFRISSISSGKTPKPALSKKNSSLVSPLILPQSKLLTLLFLLAAWRSNTDEIRSVRAILLAVPSGIKWMGTGKSFIFSNRTLASLRTVPSPPTKKMVSVLFGSKLSHSKGSSMDK